MLQLHAIHGPYVMCDQCHAKFHLPGNCINGYGNKFLVPSLAKFGMTVKGPHICKDCSPKEAA